MKKIIGVIFSLIFWLSTHGQVSILGNFTTDPTDFLGWDNTVNSDLNIRHNEPGQPIIFKIAGNEWMRYTEDGSLAVNTTTSQGAQIHIFQDKPEVAIRLFQSNFDELT